MPRRIYWPKIKKVYWCYNCNIPLMTSICPICGGNAYRVPLTDPGDARLAHEKDILLLEKAYFYEFNTYKGLKELKGKSVILLNKAPYYDEMKEVVVDGIQIGRLYYEPLLRTWRFRISRIGASRILEADRDIIEKVIVHKKRLSHLAVIRSDKEFRYGQQVLLMNTNGDIVGLGYSKGGNRIIVHSWWGDTPLPNPMIYGSRTSSLDDVLRAHEEYMYILEAQSKKFIAVTHDKISKPVIASFSGGKDSLVAMHLSISIGIDLDIMFNNTGIELPETIETVYNVAKMYGLDVIEADAGNRFWEGVYKLGIPGRDYRWCCKICKLAPLAKVVKNLWSDGALNIVGQRAYESIDRARSPRIWRLRWAPQLLNISPINNWSQFEVWLYIYRHKLTSVVNPLYFMGYERIGCFMCPASTLAELELVSQTHQELWSKWLEALNYWANKLNKPKEWIEYGLWRWNGPARYRTMIARRLSIVDKIDNWYETFWYMASPPINEVERNGNIIKIVYRDPISLHAIADQLSIIRPSKYSFNFRENKAILEFNNLIVTIDNNTIYSKITNENDIEIIIDIVKLYHRWKLCLGCRSCEYNCPKNVFKVDEKNGIRRPWVSNPRECLGCKFCLYNCPISDMYIEHIIAPLIMNDYEAWRRETRVHHDEILDRIRAYIKANIKIENRSVENRYLDEDKLDINAFLNL